MSKETKLGYGFLLAGVGLPYLIEKLFSPRIALAAAIVLMFVGICLLVAGHLHDRQRLATKVIFILLAVMVLGVGIAWRVRPKTEEAPPSASKQSNEEVRQLPPVVPKPSEKRKKTAPSVPSPSIAPEMQSRLRIAQVVTIGPGLGPFPAVNIYYDIVGKVPADSIANHFAVGFSSAQLPLERLYEIQDGLLHWVGWNDEMSARSQHQLFPGDVGDFTTIPSMEGQLADDFRRSWNDVASGKTVLYVFIAFKYHDKTMSPGKNGVTEDCFWFSGNFARHNCGRGRAFVE
jgi:hypothetical protein